VVVEAMAGVASRLARERRRPGHSGSRREGERLAYLSMNSIACTSAAGVTLNRPV
jgi:hypothetical protein